MPVEPAFEKAKAAHQAAVQSYLRAAAAVPEAQWNTPRRPGAWSPAQITEHLRLSYDMLGGEIAGGVGLRVRTSWWQRLIVRFKFLPGILEHGTIPPGARTPSELRPGEGPFPRDESLAALTSRAASCEAALGSRWNEPGAYATHHVFGRLTPKEILRFAAVHAEHHAAQLTSR